MPATFAASAGDIPRRLSRSIRDTCDCPRCSRTSHDHYLTRRVNVSCLRICYLVLLICLFAAASSTQNCVETDFLANASFNNVAVPFDVPIYNVQ